MHFGAILPNFGAETSPARIRGVAELAEELGFDSIWATEHIVVGPDGVDEWACVYEPLVTLGWVAGWTERVGLGTSILLVPLHNPFHLAKEVATLQELSGGRVTLGVGMGWHRDEFEFMGVPFEGRGRRSDEAIRLMRALWRGEPSFEGEHWSYRDATAEPHPSREPEIWVGGNSHRAVRRTRELGDVWHPTRGSDAAQIRAVKERHPDLRIVPRTLPSRASTGVGTRRLRKVLQALVGHLHAFATEVGVTQDEWSDAIRVLTETGHISDERRQEFILWSDMLGLSMLVDALAHPAPRGATESTVLGPFYVPGAPLVIGGRNRIRIPNRTSR